MAKTKQHRVGLKKIAKFKDLSTGKDVQWYEYTDFMNAPNQRVLSTQRATNFAELGMNKDKMNVMFDLHAELFNAGNFIQAGTVIEYMRSLINIDFDEDAMLKLACSYYVIDGEDHESGYDLGIEEKKIELLRSNEECKSFFLSLAWSLIKNSPKDAKENIQNFIQQVSEQDRMLDEILKNSSPIMRSRFKALKSIYKGGSEKVSKDSKDIPSEST